jgi:hypothetical protein
VLTAIYYVAIRVLEQQWPGVGILLGLPSSPDTYSKAVVTAAVPSAPTANSAPVFNVISPVADTSLPADGSFQSKVEAAIAGTQAPTPEPVVPPAEAPAIVVPAVEPAVVTPVYTPPIA